MEQQLERWRWSVPWVALTLVLVGVAVIAFSLGRALVAPPQAQNSALVDDLAAPELPPAELPEATASVAQPTTTTVMVVYISGAVAHPDTYSMSGDARVKDVVIAAGGLLASADSNRINLSEHVGDAQHIHIPHQGEELVSVSGSDAPQPAAEQGQGLATAQVNLNSASAAELEGLPRIGQALAQRIIDWRSANGPFQSLADLQKVKGISPSLYDEIKDLVSVE